MSPPFFFASVWAEGADCAVPKITTLYYYPYYNTKLAVITGGTVAKRIIEKKCRMHSYSHMHEFAQDRQFHGLNSKVSNKLACYSQLEYA